MAGDPINKRVLDEGVFRDHQEFEKQMADIKLRKQQSNHLAGV